MKLSFAIHDINKNGGQERSTLEVVNCLALHHEVEVLASSHQDLAPQVRKTRVLVFMRRPLIVKDLIFRFFASLNWLPRSDVVHHATGTCVFQADAFTIQFLQKRWLKEIHKVHYLSRWKKMKEYFQVLHDYIWEEVIIFLNRRRRFFAISEQVAQDLRSLYGIQDVVLVPHGVNPQEFFPHREPALKALQERYPELEGQKILLFVGAFERKGLRTLIEALGRNPLPKEQWKLIVVGAGPISAMQQLAAKWGIESNLIFVGSQQRVAPFFQAADLFILPSHYDPFGLVGIEALACGCPSILSETSGCSSLIRQGENGYVLSDSTNSELLASLISVFFRHPEMHESRRHQAHLAVQDHHWKSLSDQYEKSFLQLAQRSS